MTEEILEEQEAGHKFGSFADNDQLIDIDSQLASFIFPDIRALYNIKLHKYKELVYNEVQISGFELYIIEQWIAERKISSLITCFTGNSKDIISAVEVILPMNPSLWPTELQAYYKELITVASPKTIKEGTLFITNLFAVDSKLNLLHIECGDIRWIWDNFKINFDLKRLHCGGRSALLLNSPTGAAEDKFSQIYKIPMDNTLREPYLHLHIRADSMQASNGNHTKNTGAIISSYSPIIDFVSLLQTALSYFNLFPSGIPMEGIIFNDIKLATHTWWEQYGKLYIGIEKPKHEAALGTRTVAGIFSLVMSCYFKLVIADCTNSKDPFDEEEFYSAIYTFQKKYGLTKTVQKPRLDHQTLDKLFTVSAKTSNSDIFKFKKAVKSTVLDITGKSSKFLTNEIITIDLDQFIENIEGGSLGLLWKGKGRLRKNARMLIQDEAFCKITYSNGNPKKALEEQHIKLAQIVNDNALSFESSSDGEDDFKNENKPNISNDSDQLIDLNRFNTKNSSTSVSSMVCNYDVNKYKLNYGINMTYQREYYRRNSVPFVNDGCRNTKVKQPTDGEGMLVKCASMSKVQDVIENWELPFDPSLIKMARYLLKVKNDLGIKNIERNKKTSFSNLFQESPELQENEKHFLELKKDLQSSFNNYSVNVKKIDHTQVGIKKKKELVNKEMHELESLTSKLRYNMRVLDRRMRDVEHSVKHFDSKIRAVEKAFMASQTCKIPEMESLMANTHLQGHLKDFLQAEDIDYNSISSRIIDRYFRKIKVLFRYYFDGFIKKYFSADLVSEEKKNV